MIWKKLLEDGSLQTKKISFREVDLVLEKSSKALKAAEILFEKDIYDSVLREAYNAMLIAGRALIFSLGYKPKTVGSHAIVIKFCELYLGKDFNILIKKYERMKEKRNYLIYGAGLIISSTEARQAIENAKTFLKVIEGKILEIKKQKKLI
jgi:uncharacterized protein (UPF0332 family)